MTQSNPMGIIMQYVMNGSDVKTALSQAAQQYPDIFPQQQVRFAMSVLSKPIDTRKQILTNMAKERGVNINAYMADIQKNFR